MNARESFRAAMRFAQNTRLTWHEAVPDETAVRWIIEGLPLKEALSEHDTQMSPKGSMVSIPAKRVFDLRNHFGYSNILSSPLSINLGPLPRFFRKTIDKRDGWVIRQTEHGVTEKLFTNHDYFMPQYLEHPVKTLDDWRNYERRFDPSDIRRYPKSWGQDFIEYLRNAEIPVGLCFHGLYAFGRELMGTVNFLMAFYDQPKLVQSMIDQRTEFLIEAMKPAVETLKSDIDFVFWHEDMAYKNGPLFSPDMFRTFMLAGYKRLSEFFYRNGIKVIFLDCDGDFRPLCPLLIEAGINGLWPLEAAAGLDAIDLRKEYGKQFLLAGNIDKRIVASGDKKAIKNEVERKISFFAADGGYIVSLDHLVSPDISLAAFEYYAETVKECLDRV